MSLILNIDTSGEHAVVSLARSGGLLSCVQNKEQREHASFIQPAVQKLLAENNTGLTNIDAIAVVNGPGSYTGLRVAVASAKGLSFATGKPLICIGTLPLMAHSAIAYAKETDLQIDNVCPMIDARRMEVFTAVYDNDLSEKISPRAMILAPDSFVDLLLQNRVLFFGNGAEKFRKTIDHTNALFAGTLETTKSLAHLSYAAFTRAEFTDLAYSEPLYLKEFYTGGN